MLPFIAEHRPMILSGRKTETRRDWTRPRAKEGSVHQARLGTWGKPFAWLMISHVHQEPLQAIDQAGAEREGYSSVDQFFEVWEGLHGKYFDPARLITVVRWDYPLFGVAGEPSPTYCWVCGCHETEIRPIMDGLQVIDPAYRTCKQCGRGWGSTWAA